MSEKVYKPIIQDGEHLIHSKKNPDRLRGLSRDENNNPDIPEWEEVDIDALIQAKIKTTIPKQKVIEKTITKTVFVEESIVESSAVGEKEETFLDKTTSTVIDSIANELSREEVMGALFKKGGKLIEKGGKYIKRFWRWLISPSTPSSESQDTRTIDRSGVVSISQDDELQEKDQIEFTVTEAQKKIIVNEVRNRVRELTALIYLLSRLVVKKEKTEEEYRLEESSIKQLLSEESTSFMRILVGNERLLDDDTRQCFADFLSGYIRSGEQLIPIPAISNETSTDEKLETRIGENNL